MKVTLLGTGTSQPDPERVQSGVLIETSSKKILFDIGSGVLHRLVQANVEIAEIEDIFISHFHIDHCSDFLTLCQTLWLMGYKKTLNLYGPPTMKEWFRGIYDVAFQYMREKLLVKQTILGENDTLYLDDVIISTCPTTHGSQQSRAFKIEHEGKSVVFTSDTAPCPEVVELAKGTNLLVHECNWLDGKHPEGVHTSPSELMSIVEKAEPKKVVLVHMWPEVISAKKEVLGIVKRRTDAEVFIGEDLMEFTL